MSARLTEEVKICPPRRQQRSDPGAPGAKLHERHRSQTNGRPDKGNASQLEQGILRRRSQRGLKHERPYLDRQDNHEQVQNVGAECILAKRQEKPAKRATDRHPCDGDKYEREGKEAGKHKQPANTEIELAKELLDDYRMGDKRWEQEPDINGDD